VPGQSWSFSFIANVDKGRQEFLSDEFEPTYALKIDFSTYRKYVSLIPSYRNNDRGRLGAYAGWTVSDALLLYGEGSLSQGSNALYPVEDPLSPFGIRMSSTKENEESLEGLLLLGASYTLEAGPTLTVEYVLNSEGYDDEDADLYLELRRRASGAFFLPNPVQALSRSVLVQTLDPRLTLLRRNYLIFQYQHLQIWNVFDVIVRFTYNLDDNSTQVNPVMEYDIGDHAQLFLVGIHNFGSNDSEFRSVVDYRWLGGIKYTF
jgi:hypothetical protein